MERYTLIVCEYCNLVYVEPQMLQVSKRTMGVIPPSTYFEWDICDSCKGGLQQQELDIKAHAEKTNAELQ